MRRAALACCALALLGAAPAGASAPCGSPLALEQVAHAPCAAWAAPASADPLGGIEVTERTAADVPGSLIAQRVLEREWTTRADSLVNPSYLTGGKSEAAAFGLSALLPGAGQLYVGERSGFLFLAAEVAAIAGVVVLNHRADQYRDDAARIAGSPADTASAWSIVRWAATGQGDVAELEALYAADPDAFYERIAEDPALAGGWASEAEREEFVALRDLSDNRLRRASLVTAALWVNHLASAFDALRAARFYNVPLRRGMELRGSARWRHHGPAVRLAVVGRF